MDERLRRQWAAAAARELGRGGVTAVARATGMSRTTRNGLLVKAELDSQHYDTRIPVSDEQLARLCLKRHTFHGQWNYTISPRKYLFT